MLLAGDREQQPGRANARAVAIGTGALDHDLVEPRLHARVGLAALAIAPILSLDPAGDAAESRLHVLPDRRAAPWHRAASRSRSCSCRCRTESPRGPARGGPSTAESSEKLHRVREAEHHPPVPRVRVVLERLANEAAAEDAALRIGNEQVRMRELVDAEPAACAARALRIVEHEVLGPDVSVDEVVRGAARVLVEALARRPCSRPWQRGPASARRRQAASQRSRP